MVHHPQYPSILIPLLLRNTKKSGLSQYLNQYPTRRYKQLNNIALHQNIQGSKHIGTIEVPRDTQEYYASSETQYWSIALCYDQEYPFQRGHLIFQT